MKFDISVFGTYRVHSITEYSYCVRDFDGTEYYDDSFETTTDLDGSILLQQLTDLIQEPITISIFIDSLDRFVIEQFDPTLGTGSTIKFDWQIKQ